MSERDGDRPLDRFFRDMFGERFRAAVQLTYRPFGEKLARLQPGGGFNLEGLGRPGAAEEKAQKGLRFAELPLEEAREAIGKARGLWRAPDPYPEADRLEDEEIALEILEVEAEVRADGARRIAITVGSPRQHGKKAAQAKSCARCASWLGECFECLGGSSWATITRPPKLSPYAPLEREGIRAQPINMTVDPIMTGVLLRAELTREELLRPAQRWLATVSLGVAPRGSTAEGRAWWEANINEGLEAAISALIRGGPSGAVRSLEALHE